MTGQARGHLVSGLVPLPLYGPWTGEEKPVPTDGLGWS
jgi:hypothetical protein